MQKPWPISNNTIVFNPALAAKYTKQIHGHLLAIKIRSFPPSSTPKPPGIRCKKSLADNDNGLGLRIIDHFNLQHPRGMDVRCRGRIGSTVWVSWFLCLHKQVLDNWYNKVGLHRSVTMKMQVLCLLHLVFHSTVQLCKLAR